MARCPSRSSARWRCQPVGTIASQCIPVPLLRESEIGAILEIQDEPEGLALKVERDDPLDFWALGHFW